jgi:phosphatidylserine/phosphatidylglycerophosphate/cardiolipin synthase-like enzyme
MLRLPADITDSPYRLPIAFFLTVPSDGSAGPYSILKTLGPDAPVGFISGLSVGVTASNRKAWPLRAVTFGTLHHKAGVLRLERLPGLRDPDSERISALVYRGVEPADPFPETLLADTFNRAWNDGRSLPLKRLQQETGATTREALYAEWKRAAVGGELPLELVWEDKGRPVAHPSATISFEIETTQPLRLLQTDDTALDLINVLDPPAFWRDVLASSQLGPEDAAFCTTWLQTHFGGRVVVEVRDEYNTPITGLTPGLGAQDVSPLADVITVSDGASVTNGFQLTRGVLIAAVATGSISIVGERSGQRLTSLDDQLLFTDSLSGQTVARAIDIPVAQTPAHIIVHALRPADWFTPQGAIIGAAFPSTAGNRPLLRYSRGNLVTELIDGNEYFEDLAAEASAITTATTDFLHIAGWGMELDTVLRDSPQFTVRDMLQANLGRLKLLLWANEYPGSSADSIGPQTLAAFNWVGSASAVYDRKHEKLPVGGKPSAAIHMKIITLSNPAGEVGYCGGIDLVRSRITDTNHSNSRRTADLSDIFYGFDGLHDIQFRVSGPAVRDLDLVLYQRWTDHRGADPTFPPPPAPTAAPAIAPPPMRHLVQVARTVPDQKVSFAQDGDYTLRNTMFNALRRAQQFVYIEDQYFTEKAIRDILLERLNAGLGFVVIVLPSTCVLRDFETPNPFVTDEHPIEEMAKVLHNAFPNQVRACLLKTARGEDIYVHSKLQIVDDIFVSCGSANLDVLGLAADESKPTSQECNVMVIDEELNRNGTRRFAQRLRMKLWGEHLGLRFESHPGLEDPVQAYQRFWQPGVDRGHVRFIPL